jgi:prophage antirepressor-like protein
MGTAGNVPTVYRLEEIEVRVAAGDGGIPLFVAKDVVESVGAVWKAGESIRHVPQEWQGVHSVWTPGGSQQMLVLTEEGVNFYLIRSDMPKALPIQKWLAGEVLPSIRKTGSYSVKPKFQIPDNLGDALILAGQIEKERRIAIERAEIAEAASEHKDKRLEITEPSHATLHAIKDQEGTVTVTWMAKWLGIHPRTELFPAIKAEGWAYRLDGTWVPTENKARLKKPYVVRWREVINGRMCMGIRLTWKGAMVLLYKFGQQHREEELKQHFSQEQQSPKQGSLDL